MPGVFCSTRDDIDSDVRRRRSLGTDSCCVLPESYSVPSCPCRRANLRDHTHARGHVGIVVRPDHRALARVPTCTAILATSASTAPRALRPMPRCATWSAQ
jgi:hypothetical protein